jgi:hypothetical protein
MRGEQRIVNDVEGGLAGMNDWLVGSWRLLSCIERRSDGSILYPMGPDGIGQLIYDRAGRVSAQMMQQGRRRFAGEDLRHATDEEKAAAWGGYFGYFGTYSVDEAAQSVTHHVEGSSFPNLAGTDQGRHYRREGRRLILDADAAWGRVSAVWEKIGGP